MKNQPGILYNQPSCSVHALSAGKVQQSGAIFFFWEETARITFRTCTLSGLYSTNVLKICFEVIFPLKLRQK